MDGSIRKIVRIRSYHQIWDPEAIFISSGKRTTVRITCSNLPLVSGIKVDHPSNKRQLAKCYRKGAITIGKASRARREYKSSRS